MTKGEFLNNWNLNREEEKELISRLKTNKQHRERLLREYAAEHLPETGLTPGQEVRIMDWGHQKKAFFSHAETNNIPPDGSIRLFFTKVKKDGTASKVVDHNLTQYFMPGKGLPEEIII